MDIVEKYARDVIAGRIIAGPMVRAACRRHLDDLVKGPLRGLRWDWDAAEYALDFFSEVLCLNGGEHEGRPFVPEPWQAFIIGSLFGWKGPDGYRRFRVAFVEIGKGNGKSPLAGGIGLFMLEADGEPRAEVYSAARDRSQATILFRDAVAMVDQSPDLDARLKRSGGKGNEWQLTDRETKSFFKPLSSDSKGKGKSGPRPHCSLLDEVHEHDSPAMIEFLRAGTKGRKQALVFMITNSGFDRNSVCYAYHALAEKVVNRTIEQDSFFAYVCGLDEGDDPFADESCWIKANPNLEVSIPAKYLREQIDEARDLEHKRSTVLRLNFCVWTQSDGSWFRPEIWDRNEASIPDEELEGLPAVAALDLSETADLSALVLLFRAPDGRRHIRAWCWLPGEGLEKRSVEEAVPWSEWHRRKILRTTPGTVIDHNEVAQFAHDLLRRYKVRALAYDRAKTRQFLLKLEDRGMSFVRVSSAEALDKALKESRADLIVYDWGQGFLGMGPAVAAVDRLLLTDNFRHGGNPLLTHCAGNVRLEEDAAANKKFSKLKSTGRIDPIVAAAMAAGLESLMPVAPLGSSVSAPGAIGAFFG